MKNHQIVIVGAGAAGIAAGCRLLENDFQDFIILEASDRVGGRVHTIPFGKGSLDLGAEWVHGEKGNCVYELASKLDLLYTSSNPFDTSNIYYSNGKMFERGTAQELMLLIDSIIDHCDYDEIKAFKGSLGEFFTKRYWPRVEPLIAAGRITQTEAEDFLRWLEHVENSIDGSPSWHQTSADEAVEYVKLEGEVLIAWKMGGYSTALDLITKRLPNPANSLKIDEKIRLKKEVKKIEWSGQRVEVTCEDGSLYSAERVLTTVSLNVLKAEARNIFHPALPTSHLEAIQGLGMGTVDKIFLEFPYRWWEPGTGGVSFVWRSEDIAQVPQELNWTTGVFGFYGEDNHPLHVLCGWIVGSHAEAMEKESDEVVMRESMALLRRFVGPSVEIPDAVSIRRSKWFSNPFVRGSYSCRMVSSNAMDVWPADLAKPVVNDAGKQVLLFAGEATHDHLFSTVHGAIESGRREADRILSFQERDNIRTVTIVGAGIAGLAAASALVEAGVDVLVLEAQNAPGGRILTTPSDAGLLELGAQWLHGEDSNLHKLAAEGDLLSEDTSEEGQGTYYRQDGSIVPYNLVTEVRTTMIESLQTCEKFVNKSKAPASVGHLLDTDFEKYKRSSESFATHGPVLDELYSWNERFQLIDNSCDDLHNLSAKSWGLYKECGENHCINLKQGFSSLIASIVNKLPEGTVVVNTPVRCIEWLNQSDATSRKARAKIICDKMEVLTNHVIVTSSLGYLKENKNRMFNPPLPTSLSKAINLLGFGSITKIFLVYDRPWWPKTERGFQLVWRDDASVKESVPWAEGATGFDVLPGRPVLLGWVGGTSAALVEQIPEVRLKEQATELLRRFIGKKDIPPPKKILRSLWHSNEFVRGAYSHIPSSCDAENVTSASLSQPVYTKFKKGPIDKAPTILLAGEACSKEYYSTVHGAYDSGRDQAQVVVDFIKKSKIAKL